MGFWNFFTTKRPKIQDSFFGELTFIEGKEPHQSFFEGWRHFKPIAKEIEVNVAGELNEPTRQQQKEFLIGWKIITGVC